MTSNSPQAIILDSVSKVYKLYQNPVDRVKEAFSPIKKSYNKPFHALKNISVRIDWGKTVGIVGRNGCGKSTLLQIICGIMPPTSGHVLVNGRISAILELGAGFNPEFSGKDNVYLNCSILGFEHHDIDKRYDNICQFADIGDFIDRPVKTYSSGMAMRLAFSIAINVDPQILVIDEALSVGDSAFQRKCFSKIKSLQENGTTILFVSHAAESVVQLCDSALLIDEGEVIYAGSPKKVVSHYHKLLFAPKEKISSIRNSILENKLLKENHTPLISTEASNEAKSPEQPEISKASYNEGLVSKTINWYVQNGAEISNPYVQTLNGRKVNILVHNEEYYFTYTVTFSQDAFNVRFGMLIKTVKGFELGGYGNPLEERVQEYIPKGSVAHVKLQFSCSLLQGTYFINAGVTGIIGETIEFLHRGIDLIMFDVMPEPNIGATAIIDFKIKADVSVNS